MANPVKIVIIKKRKEKKKEKNIVSKKRRLRITVLRPMISSPCCLPVRNVECQKLLREYFA